ncbi:hypothetical protein A6A27_35120 [Micromonospora sp. CB01531]|nr:hypothetical protein A6A27_35120 [Micromonospora sp. CB01531]
MRGLRMLDAVTDITITVPAASGPAHGVALGRPLMTMSTIWRPANVRFARAKYPGHGSRSGA